MQLVNHPEEELKIKSGMVVSIPRFKGQSMAEATLLAQKPSQPIKDAEKKSSPKKVVKLDDRTKTNNQAKHDKQNNILIWNKIILSVQKPVDIFAPYHFLQRFKAMCLAYSEIVQLFLFSVKPDII